MKQCPNCGKEMSDRAAAEAEQRRALEAIKKLSIEHLLALRLMLKKTASKPERKRLLKEIGRKQKGLGIMTEPIGGLPMEGT